MSRPRLEAVDVLRGVVMILMALDHTRDFFGSPNVNPTDLGRATALLFLTRWITHFCAPVFFLLTGTSAYLSLRSKSRSQLSRYLFTRGLWLLFLDLIVFRCLGLQFNFGAHVVILNVLWALGWAMMVLALLVHLPLAAIASFGIVLIVGHNLLDPIRSSNPLWSILHVQNFVLRTPQHSILVVYPLIPWVGVTAVGYCLAVVYDWTAERRRRFLLRLGLALTAAFAILRAVNIYGDPSPWTTQVPLSFPQHNEVSTLLAVSTHDARPCSSSPRGGRRLDATRAAAGVDLWQGAAVLFPGAHAAHSYARRCRVLCALRAGSRDV